jgi:endonuclease/exonuclease/phosphatase (EEP) superfamily protein YafD
MDDQQQQRVNQAAEEFANALRESYQTVAGRGESAYELNAQLTEQFFNSVVNNLQTQAEANRQTGEQLAEQAQRGQEASRQLTQESVQAYMDFLNSMFSFSQAGTQEAQGCSESHLRKRSKHDLFGAGAPSGSRPS